MSVSTITAQALIVPALALAVRTPPAAVHVDPSADDRIVDMAREGIDIAIRTGSPASDTLVAREISQLTRRPYAPPAYVERHGPPTHPDELEQHRLIGNSGIAASTSGGRPAATRDFTVRG